MNKHLLLGSALLVAISAYPQAGKQTRPRPAGVVNRQPALYKSISEEGAGKPANTSIHPVKNAAVAGSQAKTAATSATSCVRFSGSANAFGFYQDGHEGLQYNDKVNAISFVHRCSPAYTSIPNGNTGVMVAKWSINQGTSWDSTVIWTNTTNFARYPQGGIYNPAGNTNVNNAYFVGMGETTPGSGFNGSWYASKKITTPGNLTPGTDMQFTSNTAPFASLGKKIDFPRYGFSADNLVVRGLGEIVNDINDVTSAPYYSNPRGVAVVKGTFNAGVFIWSYDSLVPPTTLRSGGSKQISSRWSDMAWDDAGVVGYVMMLGSRAGTTGAMKGYQPIVYKTTNSGASWSLLPANDFTTIQFQGLVDRLWATNSNTNLVVPSFSGGEGWDMAVDVNGNMHLAITVVGTPLLNNDSLEYTSQWGTEMYSFPHHGSFNYPTIYDFYTTSSGGWNYHIVDSMLTEGPSGTSGQGGYTTNPWAAAGMPLTARIQIAHSIDRKKMFYSWTVTDTSLNNTYWNDYPNIIMRGYDVTIDKVTPRVAVTAGLANADQSAFLHMMSNRAMLTNVATNQNEIPFTITYNSAYDGNSPVTHYYVKGASLVQADFTINPMRPVGVQNLTANTSNYEVTNFPNPASGATTIMVSLKDPKPFELNIYSSMGQLIKTISVDGKTGNNEVNLDLSNLSSGVYVYSIKADNSIVTKKLVVQ